MTALHIAALENRSEIVDLLLDHYADTNLQSNDSDTPLHFAAARGNRAICASLIRCGCEVDRPNRRGETALLVAARARHFDLCQWFLRDAGSDALAADHTGTTVAPLIGVDFTEQALESRCHSMDFLVTKFFSELWREIAMPVEVIDSSIDSIISFATSEIDHSIDFLLDRYGDLDDETIRSGSGPTISVLIDAPIIQRLRSIDLNDPTQLRPQEKHQPLTDHMVETIDGDDEDLHIQFHEIELAEL